MKTTIRVLGAIGALTLAILVIEQAPLSAAEAGGMHAQMPDMMAQMQPMQGMGQGQMQMPDMMGQGQQMPCMGQGQQMQGMQQPSGDDGPSSLAFAGANDKMHRGMAIAYTGDADVDFVRGMIPHHQGAIDMAKIVLAFGSDPELKALAEGIVKAQEAEIAEMEAWLKKNGK
jgi:uncharacterized protein (DUF305 family)